MPSRNSKKVYDVDSYYHVYNRGVGKATIFHEEDDYAAFLDILERYVGTEPKKDRNGREYDWYGNDLHVVAFCLMPNHFHMLLFQKDAEAMTKVLQATSGAYTVYYNKKYNRSGTLMQGVYKASKIDNDAYHMYITKYIHRNPKDFLRWKWSSIQNYVATPIFNWVREDYVVNVDAKNNYKKFLIQNPTQEDTIKNIHLADR